MKHVVMFSGGVPSWLAAKRVVERHGAADLTLLFTDTHAEDADLYRFRDEGSRNIFRNMQPQTAWIAEGRDPWQVFFDERMMGNAKVDPCSRILKREPADRWLDANCDPSDTIVYVGFDWSEYHRYERLRDIRAADGWRYEAPLTWPPYLTKPEMLRQCREAGIRVPLLYDLGFAHNNCGGFCVKAGQAHFAHLLRTLPDRYAYHEQREQEFRAMVGKNVSILKDRRGKGTRPLTLKSLRERIEAGGQIDMFDVGGCGCFAP